jgi:transglutaminase-like putative cysteine protease
MKEFLRETSFLNFNDPSFDEFTSAIDSSKSSKEIALQLYFHVRDSFLYDPYHLDLRQDALKASNVLRKKRAWCVEKATVLAACARKFNIPSRLGYSIVTNHIGSEKLVYYLRKNEIVFHGYVEMFLDNKWVKCTPSFDKNICRLMDVEPLNWDGEADSMFQEFKKEKKYMEYVYFYGEFEDVPIELMNAEMKKHYPHLFTEKFETKEFSFFHL